MPAFFKNVYEVLPVQSWVISTDDKSAQDRQLVFNTLVYDLEVSDMTDYARAWSNLLN